MFLSVSFQWPLLSSHIPSGGRRGLSYLHAAPWSRHVLWVVTLLFPCSLPLPDHSHSFLMKVVWRPRIALEKKPLPPPPLSSSSTPLFPLYWIPPPYHLSLNTPRPFLLSLRGPLGGILFSLPAGFVDTQSIYGSLSPLPPLFLTLTHTPPLNSTLRFPWTVKLPQLWTVLA